MTTARNEVACQQCELHGLCRGLGLGSSDETCLQRVVSRRLPVAKHELLYPANAPGDAVFAVKSGTFKSVVALADGSEQIVDFHYPGELIGLEGVAAGHYGFAVRALTPSGVCRMRIDDLPLAPEEQLQFQRRLAEALSRKAHHSHSSFLLIGAKGAEQRLATFLIGVSERLSVRGLPSRRFRLPMGRHDIANYLGLAVETVSRTFTRFQNDGILTLRARDTRIVDMQRLRDLARLPPAETLRRMVGPAATAGDHPRH